MTKTQNLFNKPIQEQVDHLLKIVLRNPNVKEIVESNPFPDNDHWYLGAGCICQTVWNYLSGNEVTQNIKDYDLVYYNADDLSKKSETKEQERIRQKFSHPSADLDVVNEARVHLWFEEDFGKKIDQFKSCEDAINEWPTPATAIGINKLGNKINVYAPFGLNDLFEMVVRPNKPSVIKWVYEKKVKSWTRNWPKLTVIPWEEG